MSNDYVSCQRRCRRRGQRILTALDGEHADRAETINMLIQNLEDMHARTLIYSQGNAWMGPRFAGRIRSMLITESYNGHQTDTYRAGPL